MENGQLRTKNQNGQVIIILLLLMLVLLSIGLAITQRSITDVTTSTQTEQSSRALSAAEAGIEKALSGTAAGPPISFGNDSTATINASQLLPTDGTAIEYPAIGRETVAQFWFTDPAISGGGVSGTLFNGLMGYWRMDESGTVNNNVPDSFGLNNGTATNVSSTWGKFGNARVFSSGTSEIIVTEKNSSLGTPSLATNNFTVAGWVKPNVFDTIFPENWFSIYNRRGTGIGVTLEYSGTTPGQLNCSAQITGAVSSVGVTGSSIPLGTWTHVACSYNGDTMKLYINGGLITTSSSVPGTVRYGLSPLVKLGSNIVDPRGTPNGSIDDLGYWDRALSDVDISTLAGGKSIQNTSGSLQSGLVSYWKMDEVSDTNVLDATGVNDLTATTTVASDLNGKIGRARVFDSLTGADFIYSDYLNLLNLGYDSLTFAAWVNLTSPQPSESWGTIIAQWDSATPIALFGYAKDTRKLFLNLGLAGCATSTGTYLSSSSLSLGQWNHVAVSRSSGTGQIKFYINGIDASDPAITPMSGALCKNPVQAILGYTYNIPTLAMHGYLDEVAMWNRVLTDTEISSLAIPTVSTYNASDVDVYFGTENTTDKPAIEVKIVMRSNDGFHTKNYYLDSSTRSPANNFTKVSGCGSVSLASTILSQTARNFYCKYTISSIPDLGNTGFLCPNTTTNCQLILARVRLLYSNENHPIALAPKLGAQFPPQINIYNATGKSGQSEKQIRAFKVKDVVPPWFDFALFSVNEIKK